MGGTDGPDLVTGTIDVNTNETVDIRAEAAVELKLELLDTGKFLL